MSVRRKHERGQATVELALVLPLLALVLLGVVQIALIGRDSIAVTHAARAAARAAAIDVGSGEPAARGATGLDAARLSVTVTGDRERGGIVTVSVSYDDPTDVPLIGRLIGDVRLTDRFSARVE